MAENSQKFEHLEMKIEALKKVYAEMILNTSKEAAVRVMLAERKAFGFQRELVFLKEESSRMLIRLNHTFNTQVVYYGTSELGIQEAQARSLNQQKKIDELEAQLGEAEEIIVDLRDELKQVEDKLEMAMQSQKRPHYRHAAGIDKPLLECLQQDDELYSLNASQAQEGLADLRDFSIEIGSLLPIAMGNKCNNVMDRVHTDYKNSTSVISQMKGADLSIKGCSQRICTSERNLLDLNVPISNVNDQHSQLNAHSEVSVAKARNKRKDPVIEVSYNKSNFGKSLEEPVPVSFSTSDKRCPNENELEFEGQLLDFSSCERSQGIRTLRRSPNKSVRYREAIASLQSKPRKKYVRSQELPLLGQLKACVQDQRVQSVEIPVEITQIELTDARICCETSSDDLSSKSEIMNNCSDVHPGEEVDTLVCDEEGNSDETRNVLSKKVGPASVDGLGESELIDVPIIEKSNKIHSQAENARPLKGTIHRKRRKIALNKVDENIIAETNHDMRRITKSTGFSAVKSNGSEKISHGDKGPVMQVSHQVHGLCKVEMRKAEMIQ